MNDLSSPEIICSLITLKLTAFPEAETSAHIRRGKRFEQKPRVSTVHCVFNSGVCIRARFRILQSARITRKVTRNDAQRGSIAKRTKRSTWRVRGAYVRRCIIAG